MKEVLKTAFYELIDLMTLRRGVPRTYGEHKIRFPARYARYYPADYEPALFRFLKQNLRAGGYLLGLWSTLRIILSCCQSACRSNWYGLSL